MLDTRPDAFPAGWVADNMRIGIDARSLERRRTGVARYLLNLLRVWGMEHRRHEYVLYFEHARPLDLLLDGERFTMRLPARLPLRKQNVRELIWQQTVLPLAARHDRVDLLFSPAYTMPALFGGSAAVAIHDVSYEANGAWSRLPQRWKLRALSRRAARKARAILTDSEFSKGELLTHYAVPPARVHAIPLAADDFFRQARDRQPRRITTAALGIEGGYLLFVGSMFPRRRIPTLLEAFELASRSGGPASLVLVGADCLRGSLHLSGALAAVNQRLHRRAAIHLPEVDDLELRDLYRSATAFVFLSDYEGFGLPLLEAMACGTPVISARTSAIPEVVGGAALLVNDPSDADEVSRAMVAISTDADLRAEMVERGLNRASAFTWRRCAAETMRVLEGCGAACAFPQRATSVS
jgi:glycosyltransferase involved in cell wall biosynthesis